MPTGKKIELVSFVAMYMVVMIHSTVGGSGSHFEANIVNCLTRWAVPWFFFVSGAFLKKSMDRYGWRTLLLKKTRSLVVPYALWLLLSIPVGGNADLWYLRSLICFTGCMIGLFACGLNYRNWVLTILFSILAGLLVFAGCPWFYGTPTSPFYFVAGFMFSDRFLSEWKRPKLVIVMGCIAFAIGGRVIWLMESLPTSAEMVLRNLCIVLSGVSICLLINFLPTDFSPKWPFLKVGFFIYCFHHHFVIDWISPLWTYAFSKVPMSGLIGLFVVSMVAMVASACVALLSRRYAPKAYGLLSGGR